MTQVESRQLDMERIADAISRDFGTDDLYVIASDVNADVLALHLR